MSSLTFELLSLHRLTVGTPGLAASLLDAYGDPATLFKEFDARLTPLTYGHVEKLTQTAQTTSHRRHVERDLAWCEQTDCGALILGHPDYPERLRKISDAPLILFTQGDPATLREDQISIVGSRQASPSGIEIAEQFASGLAALGFVINSGLALGIDAAAHRGALKVGGKTNAVLAIGAGDYYPRRHTRLAAEIIETGCVVTEYPTQTPARAHYFPQRNRIVTGLSQGTLVVEAREASGSVISARLAAEQGREVFAVPGPVLSNQHEGCHRLIRQGAKLVANIADVVEEFPEFAVKRHRRSTTLTPNQEKVLMVLEQGPAHADFLHHKTDIPIHELMALLLHLEIQGDVKSGSNGYQLTEPLLQ